MKYIRTKDNAIYKIENNKLIVGNIKVDCKDLQALEQEGYKIADTIEELCDSLVVADEYKRTPNIVVHNYSVKELYHKFEDLYGIEKAPIIYGAIWCEWGLKYVAKMNSDGVLELI